MKIMMKEKIMEKRERKTRRRKRRQQIKKAKEKETWQKNERKKSHQILSEAIRIPDVLQKPSRPDPGRQAAAEAAEADGQ